MIALWKMRMKLNQIATVITRKKSMACVLPTGRAKLKDSQQTLDHGDLLRNPIEC